MITFTLKRTGAPGSGCQRIDVRHKMRSLLYPVFLSCLIALGSCNDKGTNSSDARGDSAQDGSASIVAKLDKVVIPKIDIDGASIEEAVDFARVCSIRYDPERDSEFRGVSIIERQSRTNPDEAPDGYRGIGIEGTAQAKTMTYVAENVRLLDFVREIARQGGLDSYLTSVGIVFVPEGAPPFPNAKADTGDVWEVLRQSDKNQGEQGVRGQPATQSRQAKE